jgi:hypothetical protein|tara:strand:- start:319 stop:1086 length:768 start_codon:yes stop_codon:yes gene_type:complete
MKINFLQKIVTKLKTDGFLALLVLLIKLPLIIIRKIRYKRILQNPDLEYRFTKIHQHNLWSSNESVSGSGSEVGYTKPLRDWLIDTVPRLKISTLVDAPCGDFNWMKLVTPNVDINYIGLDIVDNVISKNKLKYGSPKVDFRIANICEDVLPACDFIMVRDCLFHLSYDDINNLLNNLARTDYKYFFTTTHKVERDFKNLNINSGDFRIIDLFSEPFNFDSKLVSDRVDDYPIGFPQEREMILLEKKFVPTSLSG